MGRLNTHIIIFALAFLSWSNTSIGQNTAFDVIPDEEVMVSTNTTVLLAGESLYYKVYCLNKEQNALSNISKVAYALLVNDAKELVFEHKLLLKNGLASGDYYIPSSVKTGHYKLISYTKWMTNSDNPYHATDLYIVNPFSISANKKSKVSSNKTASDSLVLKDSPKQKQNFTSENLDLLVNTNSFKTRSKGSLELHGLNDMSHIGSYSISIRKTDAIELIHGVSSEENPSTNKQHTVFQLPEIRGEIVSGSVVTNENNAPVSNKIVSLSISGNETIFKNVKTNNSGKFYFSLYENYKPGQIVVQVIDPEYSKYKVVLDAFSFNYFDELSFNELDLHPNIKNWLKERSVNNQIESAYFDSKKDSIINNKEADYFYGKTGTTFVLDDYTRFPTLRETLIEVVQGAGVRTIDGERKIIVFAPETTLNRQIEDLEDLVLIDGIPVQDHEVLLNLAPKEIELIHVVNKVYFYGPNIYNGLLSVKTKKENFALPYNTPVANQEIQSPLNRKVFYSQNYDLDTKKFDRIPDHRTQLLWLPEFEIQDKSIEIPFFTSDILGTFEVLVEGLTKDGKRVKLTKYFEVE